MLDRQDRLTTFLQDTPWATWRSQPLPIDASTRSYRRLTDGPNSVIVMDAPPDDGQSVLPFITIAKALRRMQLAAPKILKAAPDDGFLVIEDLGTDDFAKTLSATPDLDQTLYQVAADVLIHLRQQDAPDLERMTPKVGGDMVRIVGEFYVQSDDLADALADAVTNALTQFCGPPDTLALRDFHAENLIWRPERSGLNRVGLLDFQDAFLAPDGYDLASLLRDARRDVSAACTEHTINHFANATGIPISQVELMIAVLSVQRNLRILGVFGRLIQTFGKRRYIPMLPRVWGHVMRDVQHPALGKLQAIVHAGIPAPDHQSITAWTA